MKRISLVLVLLAVLIAFIGAEESTPPDSTEKKTDEVINQKLDKIIDTQEKMYQQQKNEPLEGKNYGVEFNFFRLLTVSKSTTLSGTFSLFNVNRNMEIAFPVYYSNPYDKHDINVFTLDSHARLFLGNTQNGFYLSAFGRYAHLKGYLENYNHDSNNDYADNHTEDKFGIGIGIGYRYFSYKRLYWGTSFSYGRYIIGKNDIFYEDWYSYNDDSQQIWDFELLKFGIAF